MWSREAPKLSGHCVDNAKDRTVGAFWERQFCIMAGSIGRSFSPHQLKRVGSAAAYAQSHGKWNSYTLPDVTIWTAPGEHHEIKHKSPTNYGSIGLEEYRFRALKWFAEETVSGVYYTLHRWDLAPGGRDGLENRIEDWFTASVDALGEAEHMEFPGYSWVNGEKKKVPILYWPVSCFTPLSDLWLARSDAA